MTDPTTGRLTAAIETPDESETAGRTVFLVIVWLSAGIGLFAQITDSASADRILAAVGLLLVLGAWLHLLHRVQSWRHTIPPGRVTLMLLGVYVLLIALLLLDQAYLILLFGVYSLTFGFAVDHRRAAALSFVVTMIWVGAWLLHDLPTGALITPILVWGTLVVIAGVLDRVSAQSQERRQLLTEIHETRAALAEAEQQRGVLAERQRVASEIHDTLAQGFTSIVLLSEAMGSQASVLSPQVMRDRLGLVEQTARDNLAATRRLVQDLQPIELDSGSLVESIDLVGTKHQTATGVAVEVNVVGQVRSLGGAADVAVLRSIQEALANAAKHARAERIAVDLTFSPDSMEVTVADDGVGFDPAQPPVEVAGVIGGRGIGILVDRVQALGGMATIDSVVGTGTTVRISLPLRELS